MIGKINVIIICMVTMLALGGCRKDELVVPTEYDIIPEEYDASSSVRGFYLVNEGNMGSNKCSLDFFDYATGLYARNFYTDRNPSVVTELGDLGNAIGIY
ncbi:MAG: YncE family protein, partial [Muribaculaceae bacterium]|nr:YncE family protein [Muribaculaceae bacterium]